ncbi:MAG: hypothetical protein QXG00_08015 [Candidatus Woesearchaeota archaeon]
MNQELLKRQKGMCGHCGKKFDENSEKQELLYNLIKNDDNIEELNLNNLSIVCTNCYQYLLNYKKNDHSLPLKKYLFPYSNFTDYTIENAVIDLTKDLQEFENFVQTNNEWKNSLNTLKDYNKIIYGLNLSREHHKEVYNITNAIFELLNKRQLEEQQRQEQVLYNNYISLKQKFEEAIANSQSINDFKESRELLLAVQNELKEINLNKEHREELVILLNKAFEELNKKFAQQKESYEMECSENYLILKKKIDEALNAVLKSNDIRKSRLILINVQNEFKGLKLKKEQREEQYARIQNAFEELNKKQQEEQEEYEKECSENYEKLVKFVTNVIELSEITSSFKEAREKLIEAQNNIKNSKLKKEDREELFQRIRTAFDSLIERQNTERDTYDKECIDNYHMLKTNIEGAIIFAQNSTNFKQARETLISAQNAIKGMRLRKEHRDELYSIIRENFNELNRKQTEERIQFEKETSENYSKLNTRVETIEKEIINSNDFRQIRENLIAIQNELRIIKLKKEQRDELFGKIRTAFESFDKKRNEYKESIKKEKREKLNNLLLNLEDRLVRIEDSISWDVKSLEFQKDKLEKLNSKPEEETQKVEILKIIESIEARINDKQSSINDVKARIMSIQQELNNI